MNYVIRQGFTVFLNGLVYTGGQTVDLSDLDFERHKLKLENIPASVLPTGNTNSNPNPNNVTSIQISLNADTWQDFGSALTIGSFRVLSADKIDLTDSFEYRQLSGQWQIRSLITQTNLQIILE